MQLQAIILNHYKRYPCMKVEDLVKLIYQNEFGCGHFITDAKSSLLRLKEEAKNIREAAPSASPLIEDIGNGFARFNLAASRGLALDLVNRFFVATANLAQGDKKSFESKLAELITLIQTGHLPFCLTQAQAYLADYKREGYPPVSHSPAYKRTYNPSYRVIDAMFGHYLPLFQAIEEQLKEKEQVVVAIDGPAGSGKSTLARLLQSIYHCPVIRMDHFFLRPEQRTSSRLEEAGGNIDYERFQKEVLPPLKRGEGFNYQIYDCQTNTFHSSAQIKRCSLRIVEGSYSLHPAFRASYDLKIFLTIKPENQLARLKRRNPKLLGRFVQEWLPLEDKYFTTCQIGAASDLIFPEYKHFPKGNIGKESKGGN